MSQLPPNGPAKKSKLPLWLILLLIAVPALFVVLGVGAAIAIYGVRKYVVNAKEAEGRSAVVALARGIARCAADKGALPETSEAVPAAFGMVSGKKYMSNETDWASNAAFVCASFRLTQPQYFQYQWVQVNAERGYAEAVSDLDGNGSSDLILRAEVRCVDGRCSPAERADEVQR